SLASLSVWSICSYHVRLLSSILHLFFCVFFFFQAEDGIRDWSVTGVQTCASSDLNDDFGDGGLARKAAASDLIWRGFDADTSDRSEERRVGKECRSRWSPDH